VLEAGDENELGASGGYSIAAEVVALRLDYETECGFMRGGSGTLVVGGMRVEPGRDAGSILQLQRIGHE
jgi:hypothetical protein